MQRCNAAVKRYGSTIGEFRAAMGEPKTARRDSEASRNRQRRGERPVTADNAVLIGFEQQVKTRR